MFPFPLRLLHAAMIPPVPVLMALAVLPVQAADTMSKIRETHAIVLGVREAVPPFSFANAQEQPVGCSIDLCLHAVEEIKRELNPLDVKIQ